MTKPETQTGLWVRASAHWHGDGNRISRGQIVYVDPTHPTVARGIRHNWLIPLPGQDWHESARPEAHDNPGSLELRSA